MYDRVSELNAARRSGEEQGRKIVAIKIAKRMKAKGEPVSEIVKFSELPESEIEAL